MTPCCPSNRIFSFNPTSGGRWFRLLEKKADTQYSANKVQNIKKQSWNDYDMETLWKKMVLKGDIYLVLYLIYKDNLMMFTRGN